ncbi:hypothetical protein OC846_004384 [Tilletia horrida]|uniref:Brl1/Brr6 domain-containing protein n=1 Tax=Tilletia horrida TaxID=155126 RepID=A0AAN6GQK8_9BASI|nr:hypothetical protein OC845_003927 [Tilletia horrida]KAK0548696.1 hypothetical protein OC846_004384 [Tilletia horrida]KAK0566935.1 hypothetical protein OC861_002978 [Tilletia horrida]
MATAFSPGRSSLNQRHLSRGQSNSNHTDASRGREAPMDFSYEQQHGAASSSASPFLAALQSEAARRSQHQSRQTSPLPPPATEEPMDDADEGQDEEQDHFDQDISMASVGAAVHEETDASPPSPLSLALRSQQHDNQQIPSLSSPQYDSSGAPLPQQQDTHSFHPRITPATTINYFLAPFFPATFHHNDPSQQLQPFQPHLGPGDSTANAGAVGAVQQQQQQNPQSIRNQWIGSGVHHMDWPELLLGHAQFIFNASLLMATLYLLFAIARTIQQDVEWKWLEYRAELETHIAACRTSYERNHCSSPTLGVDFQAQCALWARCMQRDPDGVGRSRVFAETVADIANGFVDRVSWKTMAFTLLCLFILVGGTNSTLSSYRHAYAAKRYSSQSQSRNKGQRKAKGGGGSNSSRRVKGAAPAQQPRLTHGAPTS